MNHTIGQAYVFLLRRQWYLPLSLFVFYCTTLTLDAYAVQSSSLSMAVALMHLVIIPLVFAGVMGQINLIQTDPTEADLRSFLWNAGHYFWRFLAVNIFYYLVLGLLIILPLKIIGIYSTSANLSTKAEVIVYLFRIPISLLFLFCRVSMVADDGKFFPSFGRAFKVIALAPIALLVGFFWSGLTGLEAILSNHFSKSVLLQLVIFRTVLFTFAGLWVYLFLLDFYKKVKSERWHEEIVKPKIKDEQALETSRLPKIGFALILFSFIPGVNILALTKGAKALRRNPQFSLRALLACGSGGFSVLVCLIALAGALLPRGNAARQFLMLPQVQFEMSEVSKAICYVILLLLCFTVHEYAHAFAAWKLGDDTAKESGRLSLNPLVHLDLFGSIILPGIMIWRHSDMLFGWAKPVPVDTSKFANPLRDHRIVSFAGPGVNLAMAMVCFLLLTVFFFFIRLFSPEATSLNLAYPFEATSLGGIRGATFLLAGITFLKQFMYTSLTLGFFNLLPIPPLDGGWILPSLLPERARAFFEKIRPYSFVIFLLLVFSHVTDYLLAIPVLMAWGGLSLVCKVLNFA